jgi:hypothetical protein
MNTIASKNLLRTVAVLAGLVAVLSAPSLSAIELKTSLASIVADEPKDFIYKWEAPGQQPAKEEGNTTWFQTAIAADAKSVVITLEDLTVWPCLDGAILKIGGPRGGTSYYWNLTGLDIGSSITVTSDLADYGISHVSLYGCEDNVPDAGATVVLLGLGLLALGSVRRRS